jgi:DNA-binding MarR family transcriptional regulator
MATADHAPEFRRVRRATALLGEISQVSRAFELQLGRDLGVNPTDLAAMEHLIRSGPLSPTELAHRLGLTPPAITAAVGRLEALGHITRSGMPGDRRRVVIEATASSTDRALGTLLPMVMAIDATLDGFSEEDRAMITVYLDRVLAVYQRTVESE